MMTSEIQINETIPDPTITAFPNWMPMALRTQIKQYLACKKSVVMLKDQQALKDGGMGYHEFLQQRIDQAQSFMSLMEAQHGQS